MLKHKFNIFHSHKVCHLSKSYNGWEILLGAQISWHSCCIWATLLTRIYRHLLGCINSTKKDFAGGKKCKLNDRNHLGRGGILLLPEVDLMWLIHGKIIQKTSTLRTWITRDLNHLFVIERRILHVHYVPFQTPNGHTAAKPTSTGRAASAASFSPAQAQKSMVNYWPLQNLLISGKNCCLKECIKTNPQMTLALCLFKNWNRNKLIVSCTSDKGQGHFRVSCSVHKHNTNPN